MDLYDIVIAKALGGDSGGGGGSTQTVVLAQEQTIVGEQMPETQIFFAGLDLTSDITNDTITVIFDGVSYEVESNNGVYGASVSGEFPNLEVDFSEYPFALSSDGGGLLVADGQSHTIMVTMERSAIIPTGEIEIDANGWYDVTEYASANVYVPLPSLVNYITIVNNSSESIRIYHPKVNADPRNISMSNSAVGAGETIRLNVVSSTGTNAFNYPVIAIRGVMSKLSTAPTVSNGEVLEGTNAHFVAVKNDATITVQ